MHDRLLKALTDLADVRLVASLRDERLGFPATNDLRIFIPDIHIITKKRKKAGQFVYATNHEDLLTDVANALRALKVAAGPDEIVAVYQLGDFLDLWREAPGLDDKADVAARIKDDHEDLVEAIMHPKLRTRFLLGNHDLDLYRWPDYTAWERRYFFPDQALGSPSVIMVHGDIFDWLERLPDKVQSVFVHLFAPHLSPNDYAIGDMRRLVATSHGQRNYRKYIQGPGPAPVGSLKALDAATNIPARWNVQQEGVAPAENLKFLDAAAKAAAKANADYGLRLKATIIGHTHHARIAVREVPGGEFFVLVDCGAWIENCKSDDDATAMPSAQIGALCANEVRIYQLAPRA